MFCLCVYVPSFVVLNFLNKLVVQNGNCIIKSRERVFLQKRSLIGICNLVNVYLVYTKIENIRDIFDFVHSIKSTENFAQAFSGRNYIEFP